MVLNELWDQSHACISGIYGTGPIHVSQVPMGPNRPFIKLFNHEVPSRFFKVYGTGPMLIH